MALSKLGGSEIFGRSIGGGSLRVYSIQTTLCFGGIGFGCKG